VTVRPGVSWGQVVSRPAGLRTVADDAQLTAALNDGSGRPTAVLGGDLARTLGGQSLGARTEVVKFTVDLLKVRLDDGAIHGACAHVVARSPWWRGSWWSGPVLAVMNAEFLGAWDVAPRGHPNDGRVETFSCEAKFPLRQRFEVSRRLPSGMHLPHPEISTRSLSDGTWSFGRALAVFADGRKIGMSHRVEVTVMPDQATMYQ
jgi:hypothetical protein